ncbi:MAG: signal peptidase I [Spirochaetota bacterium]
MFPRRSYTETVEGRRRLFVRARIFFAVFLCYELVVSVFLETSVVTSKSMVPTMQPGDMLLLSPLPFGPDSFFGKLPAMVKPQRGDLVLVRPSFELRTGILRTVADAFIRFVSFQRLSIAAPEPGREVAGPFLVRVIAIPGDEVSMNAYVFMVRPQGSNHALTEFEFSSQRYDIDKPSLPPGWKTDYPLSGFLPQRILSRDEYFVASDMRGSSSDSRTWGPITQRHFAAKALLRYWPFARFGSF